MFKVFEATVVQYNNSCGDCAADDHDLMVDFCLLFDVNRTDCCSLVKVCCLRVRLMNESSAVLRIHRLDK